MRKGGSIICRRLSAFDISLALTQSSTYIRSMEKGKSIRSTSRENELQPGGTARERREFKNLIQVPRVRHDSVCL